MQGVAPYLGFCVRCGQAVILNNHRLVRYIAPIVERRCWSCKWVADTDSEKAARSRAHAAFHAQCEASGCTCHRSWPVRLDARCPMHGEDATVEREQAEHYAAEDAASR